MGGLESREPQPARNLAQRMDVIERHLATEMTKEPEVKENFRHMSREEYEAYCAVHKKPEIGERFQVTGHKRFNEYDYARKIGQVEYYGEVDKVGNTPDDQQEEDWLGYLVYCKTEKRYAIKVWRKQWYESEAGANTKWGQLPPSINSRWRSNYSGWYEFEPDMNVRKNPSIREFFHPQKREYKPWYPGKSDSSGCWALAIGNDYTTEPQHSLTCCVKDAKEIGKALSSVGFSVPDFNNPQCWNLDVSEIKDRISNFCRPFSSPEDTLLIYFSGHGFNHEGHDFLLPIGMELPEKKEPAPAGSCWCCCGRKSKDDDADSKTNLSDLAVSISWIKSMMHKSKAKVKILILDTCRSQEKDNQVSNEIAKSSASVANLEMTYAQVNESDLGGNLYVIHSTAEAARSWEGPKHTLSVMTKHLLELIRMKPGLELKELCNELTDRVRKSTQTTTAVQNVTADGQGWNVDFYFSI